MIKYVRHLSNPLERAEENDSKSSPTDKLTEDELTDNKAWQMRFMSDDTFSRTYAPAWWEREEMNSIVDFLELKNPRDHSEYLVCIYFFCIISSTPFLFLTVSTACFRVQYLIAPKKNPQQEDTKKAVSAIFSPKQRERQVVLLKRGTVLLGREERELMLFTNGFVVSRVELDVLVNLLLNASSSGRMEKLAPERITEQFSAINTDGGGCEYPLEFYLFFRFILVCLTLIRMHVSSAGSP